MQADFLDAHERHWADAEMLFEAQRYANADHLYGMVAECGLKRLMMEFGMEVKPNGAPKNKNDWEHANNIWARFESYRNGKVDSIDYELPIPNPFGNWDVSDRYAHQSNFDQVRVQVHRDGADVVRRLIKKAQLQGILE